MRTTACMKLIVLVSMLCLVSPARVTGAQSVGVRPGDWVDYNMQSYGEDAESFSANFTVDAVSGTAISGNIEYSNGRRFSLVARTDDVQ